jgi:hypothetical protein
VCEDGLLLKLIVIFTVRSDEQKLFNWVTCIYENSRTYTAKLFLAHPVTTAFLHCVLHVTGVRTSQRTRSASTLNKISLIAFTETINVYFENHTKTHEQRHVEWSKLASLTLNASGAYRHHWAQSKRHHTEL